MRLHQIFFSAMFLLAGVHSKAGEAPFVKELSGNQVVAANTLLVMDDKLNPAENALISSYQSIDDVVSFEIDFGTAQFFYNQNFTAKLDYTLIRYKNDLPNEIQDSLLLSLSVDFKNDGSGYKGVAYYKFNGSRKFMVRIRSISSAEMVPIKPVFKLRGQIQINRKYLFDPMATDTMRFSKTGNQLRVFWQPSQYKGAEEFDLEYTYIDKESAIATSNGWQPGMIYNIAPSTLNTWFTHNASRIVTDSSAHTINLINAEGFLLFRIRHVQYTVDDNVRVEGEWNYRAMSLGGSSLGVGLVYIDWHEPDLNWQYSVSFAEEGKKKEVVTYYDGSLRNRQMVTINNSDNVSVVQESVYDRLGRPALQVLPSPTTDNTIHFFKNFTRNQANNPYSFTDLGDGANCSPIAAAMAATSGASRYYSPQNDFAAQRPEVRHIADAENYPYTATSYTNDNTGRVKAQGGVGQYFQLNSGRETKYYYGKPTQTELDRLFGVEAGDASHYLKNMVVDPNGQVSVSYVNASGKTIATALAGAKPANMEVVDQTFVAATNVTNEIIKPSDFSVGANNSISASSTFMAALPGTYTINYSVNPMKLSTVFGQNKDSVICSTCYYDLEIKVRNDCNELLYTETVPQLGPFDSTCTGNAGGLTGTRNINVAAIGEYNVTYTLTVSRAALDSFDTWHLARNSEIRKLNDFVRQELLNADFYGCFTECSTCVDKLGSKANFSDRFKAIYIKEGMPFTLPDSLVVNQLYDSLYQNCQLMQVNCVTKRTPCDDKLDLLKTDVRPGGQYGLVDSSGRLTDLNTNVIAQRYRIAFFTNENGLRDSVTLVNQEGEDSVRLDVKQLNDSLFVVHYRESWSDSLVKLHPEYCYYLWCTGNLNSYVFDKDVEDLLDGNTAVTEGLYGRASYKTIMSRDPFFTTGAGVQFKNDMDSALARYSREYFGYSGPDRNILQMVDLILYCGNQTDPYATCSIDSSCRAVNREWEMYKRFYLNLKQRYYQRARIADPAYAGCVNCFIGEDFISHASIDKILASNEGVAKMLHDKNAYPVAAVPDNDGGTIQAYDIHPDANYYNFHVLAKYDAQGQLRWAKRLEDGVQVKSLVVSSDNKIYITGSKYIAEVPTDLYVEWEGYIQYLPFVASFDSLGNPGWSKLIYPDSVLGYEPAVNPSTLTMAGTNILVAYMSSGKGGFYLNKFDGNGNLIAGFYTEAYLDWLANVNKMITVGDTAFVNIHITWGDKILVKLNHNTGQLYWAKEPVIEEYYEPLDGDFLDYRNGILTTNTSQSVLMLNAQGGHAGAYRFGSYGNLKFTRLNDQSFFASTSDYLYTYTFKFNESGLSYGGRKVKNSSNADYTDLKFLASLSSGQVMLLGTATSNLFGPTNSSVVFMQFGDSLIENSCVWDQYTFPSPESRVVDYNDRATTISGYSSRTLPAPFGVSTYAIQEADICRFSFQPPIDSCKQNNNRKIFGRGVSGSLYAIIADSSNSVLVGKLNNSPAIRKLDASGNTMWSKRLDDQYGMGGFFRKVLKVSNGDYLAIGDYPSEGGTGGTLLLVRFTSTGQTVWAKRLGVSQFSWASNLGRSVAETAEGDFLLVGGQYQSGGSSHFIAKVSSSGALLYTKDIGISSNSEVLDIALDGDSAYVNGQIYGATSGGWGGHVYKFNHKTHQVYWSKSVNIEGRNSYPAQLYFKQNKVYLTYNSNRSIGDLSSFSTSLIVLDRAGNIVRVSTLDTLNPNIVSNVCVLDDGSALFNSYDYSQNASLHTPLSQTKLSPTGTPIWSYRYQVKGRFQTYETVVNSLGDILSVGVYSDTSSENRNGYFFKTDSNGDRDSCGTILQTVNFKSSSVVLNSYPIVFNPSADNRYSDLSKAFLDAVTKDSSFCNLSCQRDSAYVSQNANCPNGLYTSFDRPGVRHQIMTGKASQRPAPLAGFNSWRFYSVFLLKSGTNTSCRFTNVWVASCERKVVFSCPSTNDFSGRVTTPLCDNGTKLGASLRYTGPSIPANASVTVQASFQSSTILWFGTFVFLSGQTESYQCSPFPLNSDGITVTIQSVYCNLAGLDTSCASDVLPPSYCSNNQLVEYYASKQKRFPEYVNTAESATTLQNTDLSSITVNSTIALRDACSDNCSAQADYWINVLSGCSSDSVKLGQLKQALVDICRIGCSGGDIMGSSSISNDEYLVYRSFEEAITGILGAQVLSLSCTQELLANPYPYNRKPIYTERLITGTDAKICQKLSAFQADYAASGFSGSFFSYLSNTLGRGMTMDSLDVQDMISACTTCRNVLKNNITLPAAFEPNQQVLTCSTATALRAYFTGVYGNDTTHPNYETVFTNYFNHQLGFALTYDEYIDFFGRCALTATAKLYNRGMQEELEEGEDDCLESVFADVITNANLLYTAYIDSVRKDFRDAYVNRCLNASARLTMTSQLQEYQYTLYYYDQSGNLVKTVPPAGVVLLTQVQIDAVQRNRAAMDRECFSGQDQVRFNNAGHFTFANDTRFRPGTSAFSIEGWFKFRSYSTQGIYGIQDTGSAAAYGQGYLLQVRNDTLVFRVAGSASSFMEARSVRKLSALVPDTNWRHVVVQKTNNAPALLIFINGVNIPVNIVNTGFSNTVAVAPTVSPLRIGGMPVPGGSRHFNGSIRQFRYYLRALPATEVRQNFLNNCMLPANQEGLQVWSLLNEGTGVIRDERGAVNATVSGTAPTWFSNRVSIYNAHARVTIYEYNTFNQVKRQVTPDGGPSTFYYDRLGRLVVSQNEEQRLGTSALSLGPGRFSYTRYDALGRITEVGERLNSALTLSTVNFLDNTAVTNLLTGGTASQITKTIYDQALFSYQNAGTARKRVSATTYQDDANETSLDATYYSYDIMGNVKSLVQRSRELVSADNANGEKRIDYAYDLISGKVNRVTYQPGKGDQFIHRYSYDADNRVISVNTSRDGLVWQNDAKYIYHLHGPLARTELGDLKVQGMDYAYTLQGWLKGVNSSSLEAGQFDIGQDGKTGGSLPIVARDAYGYMLDYYRGDYKPIGQQAYSINSFNGPAAVASINFRDLFNGNIGGMLTNIRQLNEPMYYRYGYDQLNRIKSMDAYRGQDASANTWTAPVATTDYQERVSYDPNGNIMSYLRNGRTTTAMDNLGYSYTANTNKLRRVTDAVPSGNYTEDLDNQTNADNYTYDLIGNLKTDAAEGIGAISWTVYGKIKQITKGSTTIVYRYDAAGNRIHKLVRAGGLDTHTYYVRDAQGNVMATYDRVANTATGTNTVDLRWMEQHIYGSSRLGMWVFQQVTPSATTAPATGSALEDGYIYGNKFFELSNHLGNVLTTVSDKKVGVDDGNNGTTDYFMPEVLTAQDYYPFGMVMPGRKYTRPNMAYRYGFNGKEQDKETSSTTTYDYGFRIYSPALGRFLSVDPLTKKYPWYTPYQFAGNMPIRYIDLDGLEPANNPKAPGANEKRAIAEVSLIEAKSAKNDAEDNFFSRGSWLSEDNDIKGTYSCGPNGKWVTDTKGDPNNKFNMYVNNSATLNVDETQASHFNNYESFIVHRLMSNFVSGEGAENYNFPTNGIISNKFLGSDVLNDALAKYKTGEIKDGEAYQSPFGGKQLANDILRTGTMFSSITGFAGSTTITIKKTDANMVQITIFNVTSLTSGDLWKAIWVKEDNSNWPKSYARDPEKTTKYGNISQTFNLLIPNPQK